MNPHTPMNMRKISLLIAFLFFIKTNTTFAYSEKGHEIISAIASTCVDSSLRANVMAYLEGSSFEEAGLWMDKMRANQSYDYMKPWHYINIEKDQSYKPVSEDNIINALQKILNDFENIESMSNEQIKTNLLVLFHLIGDLHQPLHVGYGADKGGNLYQVNFNGRGTNLHKIWDDVIIQDQNINLEDCMKIFHSLPIAETEKISRINLIDWMNDSRSLLDEVYGFNGHTLDEKYMTRMKPVVENRLVYAGIRLGAILQKYFKNTSFKSYISDLEISSDTPHIEAVDAPKYINKTVAVCGKVFGGKAFKNFKLINVGDSYPKNPLTLLIKNSVELPYDPLTELLDKNICIHGRLTLYKDKPEIVIISNEQIRIIE